MTWPFVEKYVDEMWVYVDPERYSAVTGKTAEHYTDYDLAQYLALVASNQ